MFEPLDDDYMAPAGEAPTASGWLGTIFAFGWPAAMIVAAFFLTH